MHKSHRANLLAGLATVVVGYGGLGWAGAALAAEAAPPSEPAIIVTATKRETVLQTTPLAISAVSAQQIVDKQANNVTDLPRLVPSLFVQAASSQENSISLRGISSSRQGPLQDLPVAQYVDGVYLPGPYGQIFSFPDVARIEVLRGPQGVFSGRNSTGGAINVITRDPSANFGGNALFRAGSEANFDLQGFVTGPITDKILFKVGAVLHQNPGWQRMQPTTNQPGFSDGGTRTNGDTSTTFNAGLRLLPTSNWTVDIRGDWSRSDIPYLNRVLDTSPGWLATKYGLSQCDLACNKVWSEVANRFAYSENRGVGVTNRLDLGPVSIKSITAYRFSQTNIYSDSDGTDIPSSNALQDSRFRQFSQELALSSAKGDVFNWVAGVYYLHQKVTNQGAVSLPVNTAGVGSSTTLAAGAPSLSTVHGDSFSVFGNASFDITPALTLELGARYTHERKDFSRITVTTGAPQSFAYVNGGPTYAQLNLSKDVVTPRASLSYKLTPNNFAYVTFSKGAKAPGFNFGGAANTSVIFNQETVTSYEAGIKNTLFDRQLTLNLSAFWSNYDNYQLGFPVGGGIADLLGGTARISGQEVEFAFKPRALAGLTINGSVSHLNGRLKQFVVPIGIYADNPLNTTQASQVAQASANCSPVALQADNSCVLSGNRLPLAPEWSFNTDVAYRIDAGSAGVFTPNVSLQHVTRTYYTPFQVSSQGTDPYTNVDASLAWEPKDSRFRFRVWSRNLLNEHHVTFAQLSSFNRSLAAAAVGTPQQGPGANVNVLVGKVSQPVSWGGEVSFKF